MNSQVNPDYNEEDKKLVRLTNNGDSAALEALIKKNQTWIYNIALKMVSRYEDAEDITQEVLVKMITKLSTFKGNSSFRTWLYRIVVNHTLNMKRKPWERYNLSFDKYGDLIDNLESSEPENTAESEILTDGTKTACMTGMLLCLDRKQRLAMIFGGILGYDSKRGAQIMNTSPANFRQILSRARKHLRNFMFNKCGLLNENNPCRCSAKTRAAIKRGLVNPENLKFYHHTVHRIQEFVSDNLGLVDDTLEYRMQNLYREHPLHPPPDFIRK